MKKIKTLFNKIQSSQPSLGDYPALAKTIIELKKTAPQDIQKAFDTLVSKDEYLGAEKSNLLEYLFFCGK